MGERPRPGSRNASAADQLLNPGRERALRVARQEALAERARTGAVALADQRLHAEQQRLLAQAALFEAAVVLVELCQCRAEVVRLRSAARAIQSFDLERKI